MSNTLITSAKIRSRMFLQWSFEEAKEDRTDSGTLKSDSPMHDDCHQAYNNLIPHLILLCEQHSSNKILKDAIKNGVDLSDLDEKHLLNQYTVTEFKISGTSQSEGVVIVGKRYLNSDRVLKLETPFIGWFDEYEFINELIEAVEDIREEVYQYTQGKHAPISRASDPEEDLDELEDNDPINEIKDALKKTGTTMEVVVAGDEK